MEGFYPGWPVFLGTGLLLALLALPVFRLLEPAPRQDMGRVPGIDGLRGISALAVFFHHAAIYRAFLAKHAWHLTARPFYDNLGPFGVDMFFMITGFLFWRIMIAQGGRPHWLQLYTGRLFRIGPLYVLAASAALLTIFDRTGWTLHVSVAQLWQSMWHYEALGFYGVAPVNGFSLTDRVQAGVTWSLQFEWYFYAMLLVMSPFAASRLCAVLLPVVALSVVMWRFLQHGDTYFASMMIADGEFCEILFCIGMLCGGLNKYITAPKRFAGAGALGIAGALCAGFLGAPSLFYPLGVVCLGAAFYLVSAGYDVFGILRSRAAGRLGAVSYGIYLLHGLILWWVFTDPAVTEFALQSPLHFWSAILLCGVLVVLAATVLHVLVEQPAIALGRKIGHWLDRTLRRWAGMPASPPRRTN